MQSDLQRELEQLGFSERQACVYVSLLRFGKTGAMQLSLATGIPRASCYDALQQLVKQGLVLTFEDDGQQTFVCEPPERILSLLRLQAEELKLRHERAQDFVPRLSALAANGQDKPRVRVVTDMEEMNQIHVDYANMPEPIIQVVGYDAFVQLQSQSALGERRARLQKQSSQGRAILITNQKVDPPPGSGFDIRLIPSDMINLKGEMTVCGNHVLLFSFSPSLHAIEIVSPSIAETCRQTLEMAWQRAGEIEASLRVN